MAILALASAVAPHAGVAITRMVQELYGDHRVDTNLIRIENDKVRRTTYRKIGDGGKVGGWPAGVCIGIKVDLTCLSEVPKLLA